MPERNYQPATIIDVAKRAGVSPSTVSRVLNGTAVVQPVTAQRVRAAITELKFSPSAAARKLVSQRTNTLGLLLPEISGWFFQPMLRGIEASARQTGFELLIHTTQETPHPPHLLLAEHNTDGLLVFPGSIDEKELRRLHSLRFPIVLLHQIPPKDACFPFVTIENKSGAEMLVRHLIEVHRRRRIVYMQGPPSHDDSHWRERGYRQALEAHGIAFDPALVGQGGFDEEEAYAAMQILFSRGADFDAVFAGDDDAAAGVIAALVEHGRRVPQDVAVVGFDDVPFARFINPPLTTVRAPIEQVGRDAVQLLVKCIRQQACESEILLPTELVIRRSCGCA